jgi:cysteine desulfurase/selenocysteine lyase
MSDVAVTTPRTNLLTRVPDIERDMEKIRADFPILGLEIGGKPLVYLDNAASSQMPQPVIDRLVRYQTTEHANINRAVHYLSETATAEYEAARRKVQHFIHAREDREVIFTSGTTDGINLVMQGWGRKFVGAGDEIILTMLEHHSNIVPWQMLATEKGAVIRVVPIDDAGDLVIDDYEALFNDRTRLVAVTHVSNALGTINPLERMIAFAHARGVPVLVDGAQAAPHLAVDVQELDCDFYAFSGHKMCGPTGVGILYGRAELLESMQPFKGGGDMIRTVTFEKTTYNAIPHKFEAGTPPIAAAIGLGAAIDYLSAIGMPAIAAHEHRLLQRATEAIAALAGVRILGTSKHKAAVLSFVVDGIHPHDVGTLLNQEGVAVRTGHHCAQPLMKRLGVAATSRASFAFYNTIADVDALAAGIRSVQRVFA